MGTKIAESRGMQQTQGHTPAQGQVFWRSRRLLRLSKARTAIRAISLLGDAIAIAVAHIAAKIVTMRLFRVPEVALNPQHYVAFYLPFLLAVLLVFEKNERPESRRPERELEVTVKGVSLAFLLLIGTNFVAFKLGFSRYLMVIWYLLTLVALLTVRYGLRFFYDLFWRKGIGQKRTILIGSPQRLFELQTLLTIQRHRGYKLIGIVTAGNGTPARLNVNTLPVLGSLDTWHDAVRTFHAEQVVIALDDNTAQAHGLVSDSLKCCLAEGVDVQIRSDLLASREFNYKLDEFSGFLRFFAAPRWSKQAQRAFKIAFDLAAGVLGSLLTIGILPIVGLAIKLDDGGPIFYPSEYIDRDGTVRCYLKFRSMCPDAKKMLQMDPTLRFEFEKKHKLVNDPRVTRVGRFLRKYSIDELPTFFSIARGRLSLVGPRTICGTQADEYGERLAKLLSMKPGLTGFWQVMGRQLTTYQEKVQMDMFYIDHWSIWLDLWIVAKTFVQVLRADGAY